MGRKMDRVNGMKEFTDMTEIKSILAADKTPKFWSSSVPSTSDIVK